MTPEQAVARRLGANHLAERLPADSFVAAARFGLQDTAPRDALLSMHARVDTCPPDAWTARGLVQTYGPRQAVYVVPQDDFATWTLGSSAWALVADELVRIDLAGHEAWVLAEDGTRAGWQAVAPVHGVRLLPAPDLQLLARDRAGLFVGPGLRPLDPTSDPFHPNGVLVDGVLVGSWGRRGGRVDVRFSRRVDRAAHEAVEAEALTMPVPGVQMSVEIADIG